MKKSLVVALILALAVSCSNRKEYKDEDYKQMQQDYEKKKAELNRAKGKLYKENKEKLMGLAELFTTLKDTAKSFENAPDDTTYFKDDIAMEAINYSMGFDMYSSQKVKTDAPEAKAIFLHRMLVDSSDILFSDPIEKLLACYESNNDIPCLNMKEAEIQTILDLKYAFVVDEILKVGPQLKSNDEFESGFLLGRIICYDLVKKSPLLAFVFGAQNSEQVSYYQGMGKMKIEEDFKSNIKKAVKEACKKHFLFK